MLLVGRQVIEREEGLLRGNDISTALPIWVSWSFVGLAREAQLGYWY